VEGIHLLYLEKNKIFSLSCQPICNSALKIPSNVNVDHWKSFIQMREEINNPLTPSGAKALLKKLEEYGIDANQSLINAIIGNYSNVLEPNYERVSCGPSRTHHNLLER
jgi:hypothetical protein